MVREAPYSLWLNGALLERGACSPGGWEDLALGRLYTAGLLSGTAAVRSLSAGADGTLRVEAEAQRMLAEESVLNQAKQRSAELMRQAEERSRELKRSANEYCEDALRRTEEAVAEAYDEIKKSRARFRAAASATAAGSPSGGRAAYDAAAEED